MARVQFFGQYLLASGTITPEQLADAIDYQESVNLPLGALALSKALLSERQVLHIHTLQKRTDRPFGEIAVQKGWLTRGQLDDLLKEQAEARILLGEALVQKGHLTRDRLNDALIAYHADQAMAQEQVRQDLRGVEHALLVETAAELTARMLLRMPRIVSKLGGVVVGARPEPRRWWISMAVTGDVGFTYALTLDDEVLLPLAAGMLREVPDVAPPTEVDSLVLDVGKEFVNMVVGHVCSRLSREGQETEPAPPQIVAGADLPAPGDETWEGVALVLPQGELTAALSFPG